ncbi:MAG: 4-(cytidine 5'-diphospho)-2-C-methyl-D-erythritol kinase [Nitrospirae bacterium]|nr:MAG: 4-(cytidine 5'-diphospho)-2-C-methyl-D-erythritol kinase [Nitrospirota bacterium]
MKITLRAPAKINWFLKVIGKRQDGFHDLQSLFLPVSLYDSLEIEEADHISVTSIPFIPQEENLIYKAARILQQETGVKLGARITCHKEIPLEAGLGGGSSDAACTLSGLNRLWNVGLTVEELRSLGAHIGSDVPFFIQPVPSIVRGRGENIDPLGFTFPELTLLLVKPHCGLSTKRVYSNLNRYSPPLDLTKVKEILSTGNITSLISLSENDLEAVALRLMPELVDIKKTLLKLGAIHTLLSGSGTTVFGVFKNEGAASEASTQFETIWTRVVKIKNSP